MNSLIRKNKDPFWFLDRTFEDFSNDFFGFPFQSNSPATNIKETDVQYLIDMSIPGFNKENVTINVEDGVLTVSGNIEENKEETNDKWHRKEFRSQSFSKRWYIPEDAEAEKISAKFENGILNITLDKKTPVLPEKKTYQIEIQ